ncbi:RHS repeat domain-containing protein [Myceligenerans indicum]|uniref:RHS repeat protein n=1 Tax=Myceligenerans indicum TaxID=2593663 RepID=A0ABS1LI44_9MICO|nr:RHS repeat domain-containing protein [Myceligenerans indicum]MBL0885891.1 RHS repeat protein [Myceligenerans indicum]
MTTSQASTYVPRHVAPRALDTELQQRTGADTSSAYTSTTYQWDDADRLTEAVDDAGNTWAYEYDLLGRKTGTSADSLDPVPVLLQQ